MESWRICLRDGFLPQFSLARLQILAVALATDDPTLIQGSTVQPELRDNIDPEAACFIGYGCWKDQPNPTTKTVNDEFGEMCFEADKRLGAPAACRYFLNWFDENPRDEVFPQVLEEVNRAIEERLAVNV